MCEGCKEVSGDRPRYALMLPRISRSELRYARFELAEETTWSETSDGVIPVKADAHPCKGINQCNALNSAESDVTRPCTP
jgi:hypothetical protein